jgi:hypothetical protein
MHPHPNLPGTGIETWRCVEQQINDINQLFTRGDHNIGNSDKLFGTLRDVPLRLPYNSGQYFFAYQQPHHRA